MKRTITWITILALTAALLAGCQFKLPEVKIPYLTSDPIVCIVTAKEDRVLTVEVQQADSHYDEGDTLVVSYSTILNGSAVNVGDQITFEYDYMNKVTVKNDKPYVVVESVALTQWEPPATVEEP